MVQAQAISYNTGSNVVNANGQGTAYQTPDIASTVAKNQIAAQEDASRALPVPTPTTAPTTSATVVTPSTATSDLQQKANFLATTKDSMQTQSANNNTKPTLPTLSGYTVSATKTGATGEISGTSPDGSTYYATPVSQSPSAVISGIIGTGDTSDNTQGTGIDINAANTNFTNQENQIQSDEDSAYKTFQSTITQITNGLFPLTSAQQALVDSTSQAFDAMTSSANLKAAALASETGGVSNKVGATMGELANIDSAKAAAVAKLEQGFQDQNYKDISDAYDEFQKYEQQKTDTLKDLQANVMDTYKTLQASAQATQNSIDQIAEDASKAGAPASIVSSISAAKTVSDAITAAGDSLQTGTGQVGDYLMYKNNAIANSQTPEDYATWKEADDAQTAKEKASEDYGTAFATASGKAAGEAAAAGSTNAPTSPVTADTGAMSGITVNAPADIAPYVSFSNSGVKYVDLSSFAGTPTEKNQAVQDAQAAGYKVITNKNTALDLQNITDAMGKLSDMQTVFDANNTGNAAERDTYSAAFMWAAKALQTDPNAVGSSVYQDSALDILKAMSGVQGFRGGASMVANVRSTFPSTSNTQAVNDTIIANLQKLIGDRETALVGTPSASDQLLIAGQQATTAINAYVQNNPDDLSSVQALYNVAGATDQSVYQYLLQSGKLSTTTPATTSTSSGSDFYNPYGDNE